MRRSISALLIVAGLAAALLAGCSRPAVPADPGERVVARIGSQTVTARDFDLAMRRRGGDVPQVFTNLANRRALLDEVVRAETLAEAARRGGFFERPEVRQAAQRQAVLLLQESLKAGVATPTDAEVAARYAERRTEYSRPARVRLAVIRVLRPDDTTAAEAAATRIRRARVEALGLADENHFGAVAAVHSDDQATRYKGGDAGWFALEGAPARYPAAVMAAATGAVGSVSEVISTPEADYLVKVMERAPAEALPLDLVRENIRLALAREREQQALTALLAQHPVSVTVDEALLAELPVPPPPPGAERRRGPPAPPAD